MWNKFDFIWGDLVFGIGSKWPIIWVFASLLSKRNYATTEPKNLGWMLYDLCCVVFFCLLLFSLRYFLLNRLQFSIHKFLMVCIVTILWPTANCDFRIRRQRFLISILLYVLRRNHSFFFTFKSIYVYQSNAIVTQLKIKVGRERNSVTIFKIEMRISM